MCGITAYIGNNNVEKNLINDLKLLEYRGYDSAGVAVLCDNKIEITKAVGCIKNLEDKIISNKHATLGISHTRWATHGEATIENAHPHLSNNGEWAVVHNGIIENYAELKSDLIKKGFLFKSETDTEVVAHMLELYNNDNPMQTLIEVCNKLNGSFALAVINVNNPQTIYLAKRKSPLYLTGNEKEVFVASDPICFSGKCEDYYSLLDDEFCEASQTSLNFFDVNGNKVVKEKIKLENLSCEINKQDFEHYMIKEIHETPEVLQRIVKTYSENNVFDKIDKSIFSNMDKVIFVGCGTAYHAGLIGANYIETLAKIQARCYVASEFRYSDPLIDSKTLAIFVSQSGETADTLEALNLAKNKGAKTIALTNVLYSSIAKKADYVLPVCAGPEIAVASTKAYTAQISVLNMFAKYLSNLIKQTNYDYLRDILNLSQQIDIENFKEDLKILAKKLAEKSSALFIGRNLDYVTSEEASLKLKEITYINSQSHPAGELKHGFLALVEKDTYVFVLATQKHLLDKTLNGASEAASRGAKIILATQFDVEDKAIKNLFHTIKLKSLKEDLMPMLTIVSFQMLSYLTSVEKGFNPDKPRNLAKSVTVE